MAHGGLLPQALTRRGNGTLIACGRSPTGAAPIDDTTFYAALVINSNIAHGEYMQPRWSFWVNRHGRSAVGPSGRSGWGSACLVVAA
jgi:hypothetical protein